LVLNRFFFTLFALLALGVALVAVYSHRPRWDAELRALAWLLLANFLLVLPNLILARDGILSLENPVRMLLMLPVILAVMRFGLKTRWVCTGMSIGMLAAAPVVTWQHYVQGVAQPGIYYWHLNFSEVAMSAFAMLLAACISDRDRFTPLYLAGLLAALYCVIISGSRGSLLAIVPIVLFLVWWGCRQGTLKQMLSSRRILLLPGILLFMGIVIISNGLFIDRVELAVKQTSDYFMKGNAGTSVGVRLELWKGTLLAAREYPLLGIGERDREIFLREKIAEGELKSYVANKRHAHNDFFGALQNRGVPGLIMQLLIYALPMLIFLRALNKAKREQLVAALGGALVTISYATYSLTQVPMYNGQPLVFYIVTTSLCIGILKHSQNAISADNSRQSGQ
ncbi:MAG: O-antigen ligase family protein, partial [Nitrosomonadaceae bacterium]